MQFINRYALMSITLGFVAMLFLAQATQAQLGCPPSFWVDGVEAGQQFGHKVAWADDQNGDGFGDVIVGTWYPAPGTFGKAYVFSGLDGTICITDAAVINYGNDADIHGSYVAGGGDAEGSSGADFIVCAVLGGGCDAASNIGDAGRMHVKSGYQAGLNLQCLNGGLAYQEMGSSAAFMGDLTGDLKDEIVVGACKTPAGGTQRGRVFVYSPEQDDHSYVFAGIIRQYTGFKDYGLIGWEVDAMGDLDGDLVNDAVAGAPTNWGAVSDTGYVYALSGAASESIIWTAKGTGPGTLFGYDVNNAGDVNGDGKNDVIVGEQQSSVGGAGSGRIWMLSGADGSVIWDQPGPGTGVALGLSVIGAGDVNNDGTPDVAAGAPWYSSRGRVFVYSGIDGTMLYYLDPVGSGEAFGFNLAAGDLNGDGVKDLIVGARDYDSQRGRVYIFYNGDLDGDGTSFECDNCPAMPNPGNAMLKTGDLNGDANRTSADIILMVGYVFKGEAEPEPCESIADVDCSTLVNSADIINMVNHVFKGGPEPCDVCSAFTEPSLNCQP